MTEKERIRRDLDAAAERVRTGQRQVAAGAAVDLSDLEGSVDDMCRAIAELPADSRSSFKADLVSLLGDLDSLGAELRSRHEHLAGELRSISKGGRAAKAYGGRTGPNRK